MHSEYFTQKWVTHEPSELQQIALLVPVVWMLLVLLHLALPTCTPICIWWKTREAMWHMCVMFTLPWLSHKP